MSRRTGDWVYIMRQEKGTKCCNCGEEVGEKIVLHHIVPVACGGTNKPSNIAPLCHACHMALHQEIHRMQYVLRSGGNGRPRQPHIDGYLTTKEVSEMIGKSTRTIQVAIKNGKLRTYIIDGFKYTTLQDVITWRNIPEMKHGNRTI